MACNCLTYGDKGAQIPGIALSAVAAPLLAGQGFGNLSLWPLRPLPCAVGVGLVKTTRFAGPSGDVHFQELTEFGCFGR
jgi:hypothetical protein